MISRLKKMLIFASFVLAIGTIFQNCDNAKFTMISSDSSLQGFATPCGQESCSLDPLTNKAAVTTILLALGDQNNMKLVGNSVSNQYLAETVIRISSPEKNPKLLIVRAFNNHGEDPEDTDYIQTLLSRYQTTVINEPNSGLLPSQLQGYDLVWINNPGWPFGSKVTYDTLMSFTGGVVLQGDDMAWASDSSLSMTPLTGLKFVDNGTSVRCGGKDYPHDNNSGQQYRVSLDSKYIQGLDASAIQFRYGNDIDNTTVDNADAIVLATALGGPAACTEERPVVVYLPKK